MLFSSNLLRMMNAQQFRVPGHFIFQIAHLIEKKLTCTHICPFILDLASDALEIMNGI